MDAPNPLQHALERSPGLEQHYTLTGDGLQCAHCERYTTHQVSNARLHLAARHDAEYQQLLQAEQAVEAERLVLAQQQAAEAVRAAQPINPPRKAGKTPAKIHPFDRS